MTAKLGVLLSLAMAGSGADGSGGRFLPPGPRSRLPPLPRPRISGEGLRQHFLQTEREHLALIQRGIVELERQQRDGHPAFRPEQLERVRRYEQECRRRIEEYELLPIRPIPLRMGP